MLVKQKFLLGCGMVWAMVALGPAPAQAQYLRVRDICRVKGQEENVLIGQGLVFGLKGTGETDPPTLRALGRFLERMGSPLESLGKGRSPLDELKGVKNVASVIVSATIPPEGARQGEKLNCTVSAAFSAKSLEGGDLFLTPLHGPRPDDMTVYAQARGRVTLHKTGSPTVAVVHGGCQLERDIGCSFEQSGHFTLVIDSHHAGFPTAFEIQEALNGKRRQTEVSTGQKSDRGNVTENIAVAIDSVNVLVRIPEVYAEHRVEFVAQILDTQIARQSHDARVVINERNGVIVVGENVMVGRVAVTHKNISIETGDDAARGPLFIVDQDVDSATPRLKALVDALNALKVEPESIIDIIKSLERSGDLHGHLIIE